MARAVTAARRTARRTPSVLSCRAGLSGTGSRLSPATADEYFEILAFVIDDPKGLNFDLLEFARKAQRALVDQPILALDALHRAADHVREGIKMIREPGEAAAGIGKHPQERLRL